MGRVNSKNSVERHYDWDEQILKILGLINIARVVIWFSLFIFVVSSRFVFGQAADLLGPLFRQGVWLNVWFAVYGALILVSMFKPTWQVQSEGKRPNAAAVLDITMMALLTFLAGGVQSGFGILMLPFLAASCMLSKGRFPLLYGSYAAILVLIDTYLQLWPFDFSYTSDKFGLLVSQVVMIAAGYMSPFLSSLAATYLANADESISHHKTQFDRMSGLNRIVLNRVQEGVVVVDSAYRVWLRNHQAGLYFPDIKTGQVASQFYTLVKTWRENPNIDFDTTVKLNHADMHVRARPLMQQNTELLTLFIRSEEEKRREAQTVKLTSLGLLTANLAHEIRNPLSAMRQANDLLLSETDRNDPVMVRLTGIIERNISRIDKMIEDVSSLNKRDRINTELIIINKFWYRFTEEFYLANPSAKGCLKLEGAKENFTIRFDPMHLQQILWNLCNNAWRHSKKEKNSVIARIGALSGNELSLRIWDDGSGVSAEVLPHLFEPFNTSQEEGTGLGLYIARELAHANKGDLFYIEEDKTFELILPRK